MTTPISIGPESRQPARRCHACGYRSDAASGVNNADTMGPGDLSICINCGALGVLTEDGLRFAPAAKIDLTNLSPRDRAAIEAVVREIKARNSKEHE